MKIWIASDSTHGRMRTIEEAMTAQEVLKEFGRAESGEIIAIWWNEDSETPDKRYYWDSQYRKYRECKEY